LKNKITYHHLHALFSTVNAKSFREGFEIYSPNSITDKVFYLNKGLVQVFNIIHGRKLIKHLIFPNELFGFEGLFHESHYLNFAEPLSSSCEIKSLSTAIFQQKLDNDLMGDFLRFLGKRQQNLDWRLTSKSLETSERLVIEFIEKLGEQAGMLVGIETLIPFMLPHEDIANMLGVSRQLVTATLSKLRKLNLIYYNRDKLIIRDFNSKILKYL
jgi:CRP/FNR family transcriptional regulator